MENDIINEELWRLVPSLNNKYEVSFDGQIRNAKTKYILHQYTNKHGYCTLQVKPTPDEKKNIRMHQIVAEVFIGPCPDRHVVNHKDGNKQNNHFENLEYVTPSQNNQHALDTGLRHPANMKKYSPRGKEHYNATIDEDMVCKILKMRDETGFGCRKIANRFNISRGVVGGILTGKTWKDVVELYNKEKENTK